MGAGVGDLKQVCRSQQQMAPARGGDAAGYDVLR